MDADKTNNMEMGGMTIAELESTLVCCLMTSLDAPMQVSTMLREEMFSDKSLGFVFGVIMDLYNQGVQPDMVTVETGMRREDEARWKELNGLSFLLPAMLNVRNAENVIRYAEEVKRQYKLRCLMQLFVTLNFSSGKFDADPDKLIAEAEQSLQELRRDTAGGKAMRTVGELAEEALQWHSRRAGASEDVTRLLTGIEELDYVTGGLHRGEIIILGGRPSDGKTAVALHIAVNVAKEGKHVCLFSLEMSDLQMLNRILAGMTDVDPDHLRISGLTGKELEQLKEASRKLEHLPLYMDYTPCNTVSDIRAKVMLKSKQGECDLVVIDYLHLLSSVRQKNETQDQVVGRNVVALKQLALEADCPVLLVSQMNRACDTRADRAHIPVMSDLRDSGTIEQVADCVVFVYRPEKHGITKDERTGESLVGVGKLYIVKNRNGATGIARFRYNPSYTKITNYCNTVTS